MPPVCLDCRVPLASHDALCVSCWSGIDFIRPPVCDRFGIPMPFDPGGTSVSAAALSDPPDYDRARAVARYDGAMRRLVHDFKYRDRMELREILSGWLFNAGTDLLGDAEVVIPIPLSRSRLIWRRFNQSAVLAQAIAGRSGAAFEPLALIRTRATRSQVGLSRAERRKNVSGAFLVPAAMLDVVGGRKVVVIDDIITTGATAGAAARALKRAGASRVDVLALALVTGDDARPP